MERNIRQGIGRVIDEGIHIISGGLGGGKSLRAIDLMHQYISAGHRVATNINLRMEGFYLPDIKPSQVMRVPDKPTLESLQMLGQGSKKKDGFGLLVLDELGMWFNARTFGNKDRLPVIEFCIEMRKRQWIALFIAQKPSLIDKQVREIGSTMHTCINSKSILFLKPFPRFHYSNMVTSFGMKAGSDFYRCNYLYRAYNTRQRYASTDFEKYEPTDSALTRHYKCNNGFYSYLPQSKLPSSYLARVKKYHDAATRKTINRVSFCILISALYFLWPSNKTDIVASETLPIAEAIITEEQPSIEEIQDLEKSAHLLEGYSIDSYINVGGKARYGFRNANGDRQIQSRLERQGIKVKPRGPREALVVYPDYTFFILTR